MDQKEVGRHFEKRFVHERHKYVVSLISNSSGTTVEEVSLNTGVRGYVSGVVFENEEEALASAHQLARNLIGV